MDPQGPFFFGPELSLVDVVVVPWAVSFVIRFRSFGGGEGSRVTLPLTPIPVSTPYLPLL